MAMNGITFDIEMVGPAAATKYLQKNTVNRPLTKSHVGAFAEAMKRGEWSVNGESIKFSEEGRLLDGQHRLHAIVQSQCTVPLVVMRGVSFEAFPTIDTGKIRNGADVLSLAKEKNPSILSAALKILSYADEGKLATGIKTGGGRVTNTMQLNSLQKHPGIRAWVDLSMGARMITSMPILAAVSYLSSKGSNGDMVQQFVNEIISGAELRGDNPAFLFREKMLANRSSKRKIARREVGALVIKALNAYRAGRPVKLLKWDITREEFPEIDP